MIPVGICQCGCGGSTKKASQSDPRCGHVFGQPLRFILGHNARSPMTPEQRFWSKVTKTDDCWLWTGSQTSTGYGLFHLSMKQRNQKAHRVSWMFSKGDIPSGVSVLHHCDVPICVKPSHLFLGTDLDNSHDCIEKRRNNFGERNGRAKLTTEAIQEIRRRFALGESRKSLAEKYETCRSNIQVIVNFQAWKCVP